jgi:hypothetical protein
LVLAGGVLAVVGGLFLPWATLSAPIVGTLSVYGSEGDGQIAALAGALTVVAGILILNRKAGVAPKILSALGAAGVALVVVSDYPNISATVSESELGQVGTGMYALIVSAVLLVVGTVFVFTTDDGRGAAKVPAGADEEALSERTRQLMESEGLPWKKAWGRAVAELDSGDAESAPDG